MTTPAPISQVAAGFDADRALIHNWPAYARHAVAEYQLLGRADHPATVLLYGSAAATSRLLHTTPGEPPRPGVDESITIRSLDRDVLRTVHDTFRAARRSHAEPAVTTWLDQTEQGLVTQLLHTPTPLGDAITKWHGTLGTITTTHPVVQISIAETQRRIAAVARRAAEHTLVNQAADRAAVEPLHQAISAALAAWTRHEATLRTAFNPRDPIPADVLRQLARLQAPAAHIHQALTNPTDPGAVLTDLLRHDLGAATIAAHTTTNPALHRAAAHMSTETMAWGPLHPTNQQDPEPAPVPVPTPPSAALAPAEPLPGTAQWRDRSGLPGLTIEIERDLCRRRDLGRAAQQHPQVPGAADLIADGRQAVAELLAYGIPVVKKTLKDHTRHTDHRYPDVSQNVWLLAATAAHHFDPDRGRWTSYLKISLTNAVRAAAARTDHAGVLLPDTRSRATDPAKAAATTELNRQRQHHILAGDLTAYRLTDHDHQPAAEDTAITQHDTTQTARLTQRALTELDALPPLTRDAVIARHLQPRPLTQVADDHAVSPSTANREAKRGIDHIKDRLTQPPDIPNLDQRLAARARHEQRHPTGPTVRPSPGATP